eukprot:6156281-Alexandrium_andersonii.AAC.1
MAARCQCCEHLSWLTKQESDCEKRIAAIGQTNMCIIPGILIASVQNGSRGVELTGRDLGQPSGPRRLRASGCGR